MKPNLYSFATKELSQDAFICWLLSWASPKYEQVDPALYACGQGLVTALLRKRLSSVPEVIHSVKVERQFKRIDVLCTINDKYVILIEDKTTSKNSKHQLATYLELITKKYPPETHTVVPIYFKTHDQSSYASVLKNLYEVFTRGDFLAVLAEGIRNGVSNEIFLDFYAYLSGIEEGVQGYLTNPYESWDKHAWIGFFKHVQAELGKGKWDQTPHQYMAFWWGGHGDELVSKRYLQLNQKELQIRISVKDDSQRKVVRSQWARRVIQAAKAQGIEFSKVKYHEGKTMALAAGNYLQVDEAGIVDIPSTIAYLRQVEDFLKGLAEEIVEAA
ncbi:PD-(D/E)XK nuclease family protein [Pseudomonas luteola]